MRPFRTALLSQNTDTDQPSHSSHCSTERAVPPRRSDSTPFLEALRSGADPSVLRSREFYPVDLHHEAVMMDLCRCQVWLFVSAASCGLSLAIIDSEFHRGVLHMVSRPDASCALHSRARSKTVRSLGPPPKGVIRTVSRFRHVFLFNDRLWNA